MTISKDKKQELIGQFGHGSNDTGSAEVQIALFTARINGLTEHMRVCKNDFSSRRGLLGLVSRRRRLLDYLRRENPARYFEVISSLGIRK